MKDRLVDFVDALRGAGLGPSPSETLDAVAAVAATGVERECLRECLAASLVKDHAVRPLFDDVFDRFFAVPARRRGKSVPPVSSGAGVGSGPGGEGSGATRMQPARERGVNDRALSPERPGQKAAAAKPRDAASRALAERRRLLALPFRDMGPDDVEAARELVSELAHRFRTRWSRRRRRSRHGRLDMRRTIRRSMSRGGVPLELLLLRPRPGKTDLLALVDLSYSTATAAEFFLALVFPARAFFRRVTLLAYVDAPVEVSFEGGHVVPHEPLDLNARSDFGAVLRRVVERRGPALGRNTVLAILGDARNNRRPPRADLLARLRSRVRAVVWLNPEDPRLWNTGDSVMASYARHTDLLLSAQDPKSLVGALDRLAGAGR